MIPTFNKTENLKPLPHMWSKCIGAGRACEGLRKAWQDQLKVAVKECGFEYIRFHGLLAEDMFVYSERDGQPVYNWYYIDALYDVLMEIGIRPIVEFGFMPPQLASGDETVFWWKGNITPPADYSKWSALVEALVNHWKERYGLDEIRNWYYEVWNEPNLPPFWGGTKSEYFQLYKTTVTAVKNVDKELRVGGPATSNFVPDERFDGEREDVSKHKTNLVEDIDTLSWKGVWIQDFLAFCEKENLPVDFVSAHPYPTDFALDGHQTMKGRSRKVDSLKDDLTWLRNVIADSAYPNAEVHLTEWSSSPSSRDYSHDYLPAANYVIKSNLDNAEMATSLSYWVFTDIFEEAGGGPEAFHGGFGLLNLHGIKKPTFHAYRMLNKLGDTEIGRGDNYILTKNSDGKLGGLFHNYAKDLKQAVPIAEYPHKEVAEDIQALGNQREVQVQVDGLTPGACVEVERLSKNETTAELWKNMGYPESLTREQERMLKEQLPRKEFLFADENGTLHLNLKMEAWEIISIQEI